MGVLIGETVAKLRRVDKFPLRQRLTLPYKMRIVRSFLCNDRESGQKPFQGQLRDRVAPKLKKLAKLTEKLRLQIL